MAKNENGYRLRKLRGDPKMICSTAILLAAAVIGVVWFSSSSNRLDRSIQNERVDAVAQIGTIILEKIQILSDSYASELEQAATLLMASGADSFEEASRMLGGAEDLCLIGEDGRCFDLQGNPMYFLDIQTMFDGIFSGETTSQFCSIRMRGDYWVFSTPVRTITLGSVRMIGLLKLVDEATYANIATDMIFGNLGATYVVNPGGVILLRPAGGEGVANFTGYNLLSDMAAQGVDPAQVEALSEALAQNASAQIMTDIDGDTWLIQTLPDMQGRSIVMTVPVSITARDTFVNMRSAILSIVLTALALGALFLNWIFYFYRMDGKLKLEQAKANSKSDFMSKMSHDIRTPLNAIVGMLEIAQRSMPNERAVRECLDNAQKSSEYLISIINDVLDMSRIESGKMDIDNEPFELKALIDNVMQMEELPAQAKDLSLVLEDYTAGGVAYIGDDVRIKQCLVNLISNAIKFTPAGGTVTLTCEEKPLEDGRRLVRMSVRDTGVGMSKEFLAHAFTPFEQERSSSIASGTVGSGLGLAIVYNLAGLMGGTIHAESEQGHGSLFVLELPFVVAELPQAETQQVQAQNVERLHGKRVLLAEDNHLNRSIAAFLLHDLGLEVEEAENGKLALERFTASAPGEFALILMDIQMPVMDGLEAARRIRASGHADAMDIPIVALSANAFREDAEQSHAAGMQAHLPKPIDTNELEAALLHYIK